MSRVSCSRRAPKSGAFAVLLAALLGACSSVPRQPSLAPSDDYRPDASYSMLMAEIALQRRAYLVTAQEYMNAAEQSADPEVAQRATEFAYDYGYDILALGAAQRWLELQPDSLLANEYAGRLYLRRNELEKSLQRWRRSFDPDEMSRDELLHRVIEDHAGRVVKDTGDGVMAVFASPIEAITGAFDAQRAIAGFAWPAGQ